jgi:conjugal transfer/entry exclusion protein
MNRKIIVLVMVLTIMAGMNAAAQGYPVMDITNLFTAIENGLTMMEQLQTMYNTLKTSYDQLQQQIKNFESFDFKNLDAKDPLGSWKSINTYANRMMNYEQNIESIINRKDIKIGNGSYSLGDIFTTPPGETMRSMTMDGVSFTMIDPFERKLTTEEKAVFHQKYGMSYGNYMRINHMGEVLKKKSAEVIGYSNSLQKNLAEDREKLDSISGDLFGSESAVQQQQINNAILAIMAQDIKTQANLLGDIAEQLAVSSSQALLEKQAMQDEKNINSLDFSDGLKKMLHEMPPSSAYR